MSQFTTEMSFELFKRGFRPSKNGGLYEVSGSICNNSEWHISQPMTNTDYNGNPVEIVSVRYKSFSEGAGWQSDHEITQHYYVSVDELLDHIDNKYKQRLY